MPENVKSGERTAPEEKTVRARDLGLIVEGTPGRYNAITDVAGVEVGFCTVIAGETEPGPEAKESAGIARTGVTAILPRGKKCGACFAGRYDLNGNGELTGTHWLDDSGFLFTPILLTNTFSVGTVQEAACKWILENDLYYHSRFEGEEIKDQGFFYPVVAETYDGVLNEPHHFHVKEEHVRAALDSATGGPVAEGNVGGGTGMCCHQFKGGTGTASRVLPPEAGGYTVGVLVQANYGLRENFQFNGIPLGRLITGCDPEIHRFKQEGDTGSIVVIIATDAPFMPWQLGKLCRRATIGIGCLGGGYGNSSGDIFLAFSTANEGAYADGRGADGIARIEMLSDEWTDPYYKATAEAVEEAILNALTAARDMRGRDGNFVPALPHDQVREILKRYKR
ncbi:MAG: P1 family peptidase [Clostridia bacterium]|nr:P1 family peptidase [Clostridia bacterium]